MDFASPFEIFSDTEGERLWWSNQFGWIDNRSGADVFRNPVDMPVGYSGVEDSKLYAKDEYENNLICGDGVSVLSRVPDEAVSLVVTSPPYWGLRIYDDLEIGNEPGVQEYIDSLVSVFDQCKRVLRSDGSVFVNIGDSYASKPCGSFNGGGSVFSGRDMSGIETSGRIDKSKATGLHQKNLIGLPWKFAFAMQESGWILRSEIVWFKKSCSPESTNDRVTREHELIFHFVKSGKYKFDRSKSRRPRSVWHISSTRGPKWHKATFPKEIPERCIEMASDVGDLVLDPFSGSGTVCIAALENNRKYLGVDVSEEYTNLASKRIKCVSPKLF